MAPNQPTDPIPPSRPFLTVHWAQPSKWNPPPDPALVACVLASWACSIATFVLQRTNTDLAESIALVGLGLALAALIQASFAALAWRGRETASTPPPDP